MGRHNGLRNNYDVIKQSIETDYHKKSSSTVYTQTRTNKEGQREQNRVPHKTMGLGAIGYFDIHTSLQFNPQ
jgi:hypothetical protein